MIGPIRTSRIAVAGFAIGALLSGLTAYGLGADAGFDRHRGAHPRLATYRYGSEDPTLIDLELNDGSRVALVRGADNVYLRIDGVTFDNLAKAKAMGW